MNRLLFIVVFITSITFVSCNKDNTHDCVSCGREYVYIYKETVECFNRQNIRPDLGYTYKISTKHGIADYKAYSNNGDAFIPMVGKTYKGCYWLIKYGCGYNEIMEISLIGLSDDNKSD